MGLADEIRRQQQANAQAQSVEKQWQDSGLSRSSPIVETPHGELAALLNEARPLLSFTVKCYRGKAPDGTERVQNYSMVQKQGFLGAKGDSKLVTNARACVVDVSDQGKETPEFKIVIFSDGKFAWIKGYGWATPYSEDILEYGNAAMVRSAIVAFLAKVIE